VNETVPIPTDPATYGIMVNGQHFRATGHNTTETLFIVHDVSWELHFFPLHRLVKVVIGAEYKESQRLAALARLPIVPPATLEMPHRSPLIVPFPIRESPPEPEGA
jgi:hypothetical protein